MHERHSLSSILEKHVHSSVVALPGDAGYDRAVEIWAGGSDRRPIVVLQCRTSADIQASLRFARDHGLPLSVRGGGHDWRRRALCDGVVIDLTRMRAVDLDDRLGTIRVGGGALASDVFAVTDPRQVAAVTGASGAVGMGGLTLGGGYGPLIGRFGLALDNLVAADVVLADGSLARASDTENVDLFRALRGGGGNFGVVAAMELRVHALPTVYSGPLLYSMRSARTVLTNYLGLAQSMPDELTVQLALVSGPDGTPTLLVAPTWSGDPDASERQIAPLITSESPFAVGLRHQAYGASSTLFDAHVVNGQRVTMDTRSLPALTPDVVETMIDAFARRPSGGCAIITHEFRGAAARVPPEATAFGMREPHLMVEIIAGWNSRGIADDDEHEAWVGDLSRALAAHALPGSYANLLAGDDPARTAASFGVNGTRLMTLKRRFDPDHLFASALPLPASQDTLLTDDAFLGASAATSATVQI